MTRDATLVSELMYPDQVLYQWEWWTPTVEKAPYPTTGRTVHVWIAPREGGDPFCIDLDAGVPGVAAGESISVPVFIGDVEAGDYFYFVGPENGPLIYPVGNETALVRIKENRLR